MPALLAGNCGSTSADDGNHLAVVTKHGVDRSRLSHADMDPSRQDLQRIGFCQGAGCLEHDASRWNHLDASCSVKQAPPARECDQMEPLAVPSDRIPLQLRRAAGPLCRTTTSSILSWITAFDAIAN